MHPYGSGAVDKRPRVSATVSATNIGALQSRTLSSSATATILRTTFTEYLAVSNRLRSEGVDCELDQYKESPPEGWPRWMDRQIREAAFVLMVCTERYFKRVCGTEEPGVGHGVRWEGNLIYQHIYDSGTLNERFVPVVFSESDALFIPTPMRGATVYCLASPDGYERLYGRLTGQVRVPKPPLGERRAALPVRTVKTDPAMLIPPARSTLNCGIGRVGVGLFSCWLLKAPLCSVWHFRTISVARRIFEDWHARYGNDDVYEELRIAIIEGTSTEKKRGIRWHIGTEPDAAVRHPRRRALKPIPMPSR